jgi:ABC-type multidrug transport system ATPase subunit
MARRRDSPQHDGIRLDGVGKRYARTGAWVLRDVDLSLPARALVRVEGANGSGKSTLLRIIAGATLPDRGRVVGRPRSAYVPERFPAALPFTARDYLGHMGRIHGTPDTVDEVLDRFKALEYAGTPIAKLSKGTAQKIAVAQALLADPGLLVY